MTIIIPAWLLITIVVIFSLSAIFRMYKFGKFIKFLLPTVTEFIKEMKLKKECEL